MGQETGSSLGVEPSHLKRTDLEASLVDRVNDFTSVGVHIRLNHSKSGLSSLSKVGSGKHITVVYDLKLASENSNGGVDE